MHAELKANQEELHVVTYKTMDGITEEIHNVVDEIQEILEEQVKVQGKEEFILTSSEMNKYNEIALPPLLQVEDSKRQRLETDTERMNTETSDSEEDSFKLVAFRVLIVASCVDDDSLASTCHARSW